jgi:hypothetical protein
MSIFTDGFGTIIAGLEGGGGSVVPPGGDLSGTYNGNVVCDGDVNVLGNLEIKGSLLVLGSIYNDGGWLVTVHGDMFVSDSIYFDKSDTSTPQSNFEVGGDLMFGYMEFRQCGGTSAALIVKGDLLGKNADLLGDGTTPGTPGLTIEVGGDLFVSGFAPHPAGNGGEFYCEGSVSCTDDFRLYGGYVDVVGNAGNGGYVNIEGPVYIDDEFELNGGYSYGGNGGNGGSAYLYSDATIGYVNFEGGSVGGGSNSGNGGYGGTLYCYGNSTSMTASTCAAVTVTP